MTPTAEAQRLAAQCVAFVRNLDASALSRIGELLSAGALDSSSTMADLGDSLPLPEPQLKSLKKLLELATGLDIVPASAWLGLCLLALSKQRAYSEGQSGSPELVTSGSDWIPGARDTRSVMLEMIRSAESEILMVVYTATEGGGDVVAELAEKARRGLSIILLAEEEMDVAASILRMWPANAPKPPIYAGTSENAKRKVHGKVLVVDRRDLLVTSANLTHLGLDVNVEIGIRVRGAPAEKIAGGIISLCKDGSFRQI